MDQPIIIRRNVSSRPICATQGGSDGIKCPAGVCVYCCHGAESRKIRAEESRSRVLLMQQSSLPLSSYASSSSSSCMFTPSLSSSFIYVLHPKLTEYALLWSASLFQGTPPVLRSVFLLGGLWLILVTVCSFFFAFFPLLCLFLAQSASVWDSAACLSRKTHNPLRLQSINCCSVCVCLAEVLKDPRCSLAVMLNLQCSSSTSTVISLLPASPSELHAVSHLSRPLAASTLLLVTCVSGLKTVCGVWVISAVVRGTGGDSPFPPRLPCSCWSWTWRGNISVSHGSVLICVLVCVSGHLGSSCLRLLEIWPIC